MNIIEKLASSLGRRDEIPNTELSKSLSDKEDHKSIEELAELLTHKNKNIRSDAIKVLYEFRTPETEAHFRLRE
jgi:HEAT repeat protein